MSYLKSMHYGAGAFLLLGLGLGIIPIGVEHKALTLGVAAAYADCDELDDDPDLDTDRDSVPDCEDECPVDRRKSSAGVCGCGLADADADRDRVVDRTNACPSGDDECPADNIKVEPGDCGCGFVETSLSENGSRECGNPDGESISVTAQGSGRRVTVRFSKFHGSVNYVLSVKKRNSRGKYVRVSGYPIQNTAGNFTLNLAVGYYQLLGQVRNESNRSSTATTYHRVIRR